MSKNKSEYARMLRVHPRTFSDWTRERYSLPLTVFYRIAKQTGLSPTGIEVRNPLWHLGNAGRKGGFAHYKKYGSVTADENFRKKRWHEWWEREGKHNQTKWFAVRPISTPRKNALLAEFSGIMIGDGGISERQVVVTLNPESDREYVDFIARLMYVLFKLKPSKVRRKDSCAVNIIISRTKLVKFCMSIGLKLGNKLRQGLDIPAWIMQKSSYRKACMRGIMDTDGCIFYECHTVRGKRYCYPRLSVVSASSPLRLSIFKILRDSGFSPTIRNGRSVNLERRGDIIRYFQHIGSHNPKHVRRFEKFAGGVA